jgi:LuxR family maltose regulon positive regulatory protein
VDALNLRWLGLPTVELNGRQVKLETRKGIALLAYLSTGGQRRQREVVATMFWPEGDQRKALASLRRTLSSLNSRLPGWIEADRETLNLRENNQLWTDVAAFVDLLARVKEHCSPGHEICVECQTVLEEALKLYRGDYLEGLILGDAPQFDDWQFFQRDELRRELGEALGRLTSGRANGGNWEAAINSARRWVSLDPLNEPANRALMDAYARAGQRNAAVRHFEELQSRLYEQQEQVPEDETRRLYEQIRGLPSAPAEGAAAESWPGFPLLKTKLYIPAPPPTGVLRTELLEKLDQVERKLLTLVSAPPGFGKTTLLAEWIARTSLPIAWLSLDAGDNAPYQFLAYVIAALQSVREDLGTQAQQMLQLHQRPPPGNILTSILNDLGRLGTPCVLILDDCQFITERSVHELLAYVLDHPPAGLHVVISSRADPPLQLGRLRGSAQMLEVRTRDLRFTPDESASFLNSTMALGLSAASVGALHARTEGWAVGLQMAALSLKDHGNADSFIRDFSGSHRYVLDYLVEEVLKTQPARVQTFLVETSILDKLCGGLCDAVLDPEWRQTGESAQSMLEYLEKGNLFVIRLDDHRHWYRYHHLFADLLRARMAQSPRERIAQLHVRASNWYEAAQVPGEAIDHALAAADVDKAAALVERHAGDLIFTGNYSAVLEWIRKLPPAQKRERPWLALWTAWGTLASGTTQGVEAHIRDAEDGLRSATPGSDAAARQRMQDLSIEVLTVRTTLASMQGDHARTVDQAQQALACIPVSDARHRINILYPLGNAQFALGELGEAEKSYQDVLALAQETAFYVRRILAVHKLASISRLCGDLRRAHSLYAELLSEVEALGMQEVLGMSYVYLGLGSLHYEWNHPDEAWSMTERGVALGRRTTVPMIMADGCNLMLRLLIAAGDLETAEAMVREAQAFVDAGVSLPETREVLEANRVRLWLAQGDLASAATWGLDRQRLGPAGWSFEREPGDAALARVLIAQGAQREAHELLERLGKSAEAGGRRASLLETHLLRARAYRLEDRLGEALEFLELGLQLGEAGGWMRAFVDEGDWVAELLDVKQEAGRVQRPQIAAYVGQLKQAILHKGDMATARKSI